MKQGKEKEKSCPLTTKQKQKDLSVQLSCSVMSGSLRPHELQHTRLPCPQNSLVRILEWIPIPFSREPSWPRDQTQLFCIAGRFFNHLSHKGSPLNHQGSPQIRDCCWSVSQSCPTLCSPMDCSTPGFPVLHYLPKFAQTPVHWVDDAIQPSNPLSPLPSIFPSIRFFFNVSALYISFSNE